jgi:predicted Zn-dependent peptidase
LIQTSELPQGVRLVTEEMADVESLALGVWVGVGARDERPEEAGCSHFLEHLLFKGTDQRSAREIAEAIDSVGGDMNAFTTKELTAFYVRLLAERADVGLDVLSDILSRPALGAEDVEAERQVILDEILMHADEPADVAVEALFAAMFPGHPLGRPVLGSKCSIETMERDRIAGFFSSRYHGRQMVVSAAGRLEHERLAEGLASRLQVPADGLVVARTPPGSDCTPLVVEDRDAEQVHLAIGIRARSRHDPDRHALAVLNHVLGGGLSSRLFQEVREQRGLAYTVYSQWEPFDDAGVLVVYAASAPERLAELADVVLDVLDGLFAEGASERETEMAKGGLRAEMLLSLEESGARMSRIGRSLLLHGEVLPATEVARRVEAVDEAAMDRVRAGLRSDPRSVSLVGPGVAEAANGALGERLAGWARAGGLVRPSAEPAQIGRRGGQP